MQNEGSNNQNQDFERGEHERRKKLGMSCSKPLIRGQKLLGEGDVQRQEIYT